VIPVAKAEPGYVDQVPRRQAYEAAHPNVEILYRGPYWKAIIHEDTGQATVTRVDLRKLLDTLEALYAESDGKRGTRDQDLPIRVGPPVGAIGGQGCHKR
jgi:hypothetical protein